MKIVMVGERKMVPNCLISVAAVFQLIRSGCEAYLANVIDTTMINPGVSEVPIVNEFVDVFPEDLPGLPPQREVDFEIETIPGGCTYFYCTISNVTIGVERIKEAIRRVVR